MAKNPKTKIEYADLDPIFTPKSVAVVGATDKPGKVGHAIMLNYIDAGFSGALYPVNINGESFIIGHKAYKSVLDIGEDIDLAVISVPAKYVGGVMEECGRAGVGGVVVVSSGFAEVGQTKLQDELAAVSKKYKMPMVGPNCLGVMDVRGRNDTLFLPTFKIDRPKVGGVSFASQSGSIGASTLDLMSSAGFGLSRFISYGNAAVVDEVDILNYLAHDRHTQVIVFYLEGVKRGKAFIETAKVATKLKPVVIIKSGSTNAGAGAAQSHTASLAGSYEAYRAVFRQYGFTEAEDADDLLHFAKIFDTQPLTSGKRIAVITNGGGHGVLATDAIYKNGLALPRLDKRTEDALRRVMPATVNVRMPLDIGGDADDKRFADALRAVSNDPNVDALMVIALFQTPGADDRVSESIINYAAKRQKPMVVVSSGGAYTKSHVAVMENSGVPVYESTTAAARSLAALIGYAAYREAVLQGYASPSKRME
jgi:acetyl coenzyme A synthetase (ADP forming)-like protein